MDNKRKIKNFINYVCDYVQYEFKTSGNDSFMFDLTNDEMAYLIADKGIEKRIEKILIKEFGLNSRMAYETKPSPSLYCGGELRVKLLLR